MEKIVATALLLGVLTMIGWRANGPGQLEAANKKLTETAVAWFGGQSEVVPTVIDSVPKPPHRMQKIVREDDGKRVEMDIKDGEVTRLNIDGREIPATEWSQHQALTNDIRRDMDSAPPPPPPAPPAPGMPPMPPMPPGERLEFRTPMPAVAPPPMRSQRISTAKDAEGNTVIHLDRGGKPTDIVVKNGEVWMDGKRVQEGEAVEIEAPVEIYQQHVIINDHEMHRVHPGSEERNVIIYRNERIMPAYGPGEEARREMELSRELADKDRSMVDKDRTKQEKALRKAEKELQKAEKEIEKQHQKLEEQHRKLEAERRARDSGQ